MAAVVGSFSHRQRKFAESAGDGWLVLGPVDGHALRHWRATARYQQLPSVFDADIAHPIRDAPRAISG